ncbi:MAG: BMP family ABC transporter substrate-binding protein [Rhodobacteraceae bacterium]|nr:BMP family ABC transporter substrate-binding protein [Paracoccaceae bacterium]
MTPDPASRLRRRLLGAAAALGLVALSQPLAAPGAAALELSGEPRIAFIYAATARDGGWNEALDNARLRVEAELGVTIPTVESVPEEATALKNAIDLLIRRGFNVIVGTTYGYSEGILEAAQENPGVAFVNASGATNSDNLEGFYVRSYEAWYLAGMAAASVSETGRVGILGGFPVGVVNWDVNAFALGAQAVNPEIDVIAVYTNSWWDPVREGAVTRAMLDQGADVIANNLSSSSPFVAAEEAGAKSIGFQLDMSQHAPNGHLTSVVFNWDQHLLPTLAALKDGTWEPNPWGAFPSMADGVVALSPVSDLVPAEVRALIEETADAIKAGTFSPFDGPIHAQDGRVVIPEGTRIDDAGLWGMDFLVRGVTGTLN